MFFLPSLAPNQGGRMLLMNLNGNRTLRSFDFGSFRAYAQDERCGESFHLPFVLRLLQSLRSGRTVWRKLPSSVRPSAPSEPTLRTNGMEKASIFRSSFGSFRAYAQDERYGESFHLPFVLRLLQSLCSGRTVGRKPPSSVRPSAPSEPMLRTNGGQKASIFSS